MDIFIEQIVEKKSDVPTKLLKLSIVFLMGAVSCALLVAALLFVELPFIAISAFVTIPGVIWLGVHFLKGLTVEYEYILTNNSTNKELDIDKITGQRKRRRMFTFHLNNADAFDTVGDGFALESDITVSAHDNTYVDMWYLSVKHDSHGKVVLLFNPDDTFAVKLNSVLPHRVRKEKEELV